MKNILDYFIIIFLIEIISNTPLITQETYNLILNQSNWEPFPIHDNKFNQKDFSEANNFLGLLSLISDEKIHDVKYISDELINKRYLNSYESFDGREKWPFINYVENQILCSASWAFAAINVFSDRFSAIKSKLIKLSVHNFLTCNFLNNGCKGGTTMSSLIHLANKGTTLDICQKIKFNSISYNCQKNCQKENIKYQSFKINKNSIRRIIDIKEIKDDIFENGPIYAEMKVYEDLFHYKRGVYHNVSTNFIGYHAVRIIGWGNKDNKNYWIVANSWGKWWGEDGFFRINGENCGISQNIISFSPISQ